MENEEQGGEKERGKNNGRYREMNRIDREKEKIREIPRSWVDRKGMRVSIER